ncbi:MAG: Crp/Fnr family transcriptional regulator [Desulfotalea sp.]
MSFKGSNIFSGLDEDNLNKVHSISITMKFDRGEMIFFENDPGDGFYLIKSGKVKVYKMSGEGKEQILHIMGEGEIFGEVAVFQGRSFPANSQALSKTTLEYYPRNSFIEVIEKTPQLALNLLALLSSRLRQFGKQIESLSLKEVPRRLADYLIILSEEEKSLEFDLPISKEQLSRILGTAPETLSRIFTQFSSQGILNIKGRKIIINDKAGLDDM